MSNPTSETTPTLDTSGYVSAMGQAQQATSKVLETVGTASEGLEALGGVFGVVQEGISKAVEQIAENLSHAFEQGQQLMEQARQTSQSVASVTELNRAFGDAGLSAGDVTTALFALNKAMSGVNEEGKPTSDAFAQIGLSMADLKKQNAVQQFQSIIAGLNKIPDAAQRAAVAQQIFGQGAKDMMGVLNDSGGFNEAIEGSKSYAETMQLNAGAFEQVEKAVDKTKGKMDEFYAGTAAGLAPALEKVLGLVNKIDFGQWGKEIGQALLVITQAFKDGKLFEIVRLELTLAFEKAVNVMYGAIFGMAAAWQTVFAHIPQLLKDAFSMLINPNFWIGIGELLFAGIQSIQGRMTLLFIGVANALANRLADILDNIPFFEDVVEKIRGMSNTGTQAAASVIGQSTAQADKYTQSGLAKISGAVSPVLQEYSTTLSDELSRAISAAQTSKAIDTTGNEDKLQSDITGEAQKAAQAQNNVAQSTAPGTTAPASVVTTTAPSPGTTVSAASTTTTTTPAPPPPASTPSDSRYKLPEADRLTKLGLFTAGSLQMPGLSEAKRTANASEKMAGTLQQVLTHLTLPKGLDAGIQGVNFV